MALIRRLIYAVGRRQGAVHIGDEAAAKILFPIGKLRVRRFVPFARPAQRVRLDHAEQAGSVALARKTEGPGAAIVLTFEVTGVATDPLIQADARIIAGVKQPLAVEPWRRQRGV